MGSSAVGSLLTGFGTGYDMTGRVLRDSEIAQISQARPTETVDPATGRKVATFLGKTYNDGVPDQVALDRDRQLAMAGVFDKYGEVQRGSELRQSVRRDQIADEGLAMQRQRFDWEKQQKAQQDAHIKAQRELFQNSVIGQRGKSYAEAMAKYEAENAAYEKAVAEGRPDAIKPSPPAVTAPTVAEAMLFSAQMLANDAQHGKADPAAFMKLAESAKQVQDEGYLKMLKVAQAGAPLTQVLSSFNAAGGMKIDPNSVVSDRMVDRGGVKSRVIEVKSPDGKTQVIDTLAELDALDKADKIYTRAHQANVDRRGAAEAGRRQAEFEAGAPGRKLQGTVASLNLEKLDPKTTPARRAEIDNLLAAAGGGDKDAPAQVKLAQAIVRAGLKPDMRSALEFAMTSKDKSPEAMRADIYKAALTANLGDPKRAREATEEAMKYLAADMAPAAGEALPAPKSAAEVTKLPSGTRYRAPDGSVRIAP